MQNTVVKKTKYPGFYVFLRGNNGKESCKHDGTNWKFAKDEGGAFQPGYLFPQGW